MKKRNIDILILSDIHLGTYGCKAKELLSYLQSVNPKEIILNGDIVDIWNFKKSYFPNSHLSVISYLFHLAENGVNITYITGNHDEFLRKFKKQQFGNIYLTDHKVLVLDYKTHWIFHGDVFDSSIQHSKWLAKFGGWGYDRLIQLNYIINMILEFFGHEKYSLSKKIKNSVKKAVKYITDFEETASELAIENEYNYVICGHIHQPQIKKIVSNKGETIYMNSGDWIENLSSLEYSNSEWKIFYYDEYKEELMNNFTIQEFNYSLKELLSSILTK